MSALSESVSSLPETGLWSIDTVHSTVSFRVRHHAVAHFRSGFTNVTGQYDGATGRLSGQVEIAGLDLGIEPLKAHLLSPAFFNAEEFPTFSFASTSISQAEGELSVAGELTLRGVTKPITATGAVRGPQTVQHGGDRGVSERLGIDLAATIDRRDWGVDFNSEVAAGIINLGWEVTIDAALELVLS